MPAIRVEACVDTIESALAAEAGGADRIELCANLIEGGTTPSFGTLAACRERLQIPMHVLVRPRGGDFLYTAAEMQVMLADIEQLKRMRIDGVVSGILMADGRVDADRTATLVDAARPMSVTFHRACDVSRDWRETLDTLIALSVDRVLTSGQARTAPDGAETIAAMVEHGAGRIGILPGGGITPDTAKALVKAAGVEEIHLTGATTRASAMTFRAPHVEIGTPPPRSEYEWAQTDPQMIRRVIERLAW